MARSRRETDAEMILWDVVAEAMPGIEEACTDIEDTVVSWACGSIVINVRDDGKWKAFRIEPKNHLDAQILGVA